MTSRALPPISYRRMESNTSRSWSATAAIKRRAMAMLVPEIQNPPDRGAAIWVFELPTKK